MNILIIISRLLYFLTSILWGDVKSDKEMNTSKRNTLTQCWFIVCPLSSPMYQYCASILDLPAKLTYRDQCVNPFFVT